MNTGVNRTKVNSVFEYQTVSQGVPTIQLTYDKGQGREEEDYSK